MSISTESDNHGDPFDLQRFVQAQERVYAEVLAELRAGRKRTHWMWFIFPQLAGLGYSAMSQRYAIQSSEEARHYLAHPVLGARLIECTEAVLGVKGRSALEIFGSPDDMKLKSCMTLFAAVTAPDAPFARVLELYFGGKRDDKTLKLLDKIADRRL